MSGLGRAVGAVVGDCLAIAPGEQVVVIADSGTRAIGDALRDAAADRGAEAVLLTMAPREVDGAEPPATVAAALAAADVFIAPTSRSLSHTRARKAASDAGARGATLPGVTEDMLARLMSADLATLRDRSRRLAELLTEADEAHFTCPRGSDLRLDLTGRTGIPDDGDLDAPSAFGNLPCGEGFISPLGGEGRLVASTLAGSGKAAGEPPVLTVEEGRLASATRPEGEQPARDASRRRGGRDEPRGARHRHQRARDADRQRPRGREDPRHRPRRLRRERRDRRNRGGSRASRLRRARADAHGRRDAGAGRRAARPLNPF